MLMYGTCAVQLALCTKVVGFVRSDGRTRVKVFEYLYSDTFRMYSENISTVF